MQRLRFLSTPLLSLDFQLGLMPRLRVTKATGVRELRLLSRAEVDFADLVAKNWLLVLTLTDRAVQNKRIAELCRWYCVNHHTFLLDHKPNAKSIINDAILFSRKQREKSAAAGQEGLLPQQSLWTPDLPMIFVKHQYVGGLEELEEYEKAKKLKDLFQFGFLWQDSPASGRAEEGNLGHISLPAIHDDAALYRGIWRGHKKISATTPVAELPKFSSQHKLL
jgi:hypothetical protein